MNRFRGSAVALVTPFSQADEIDEPRLRHLIDWHIEEGTDILLIAGTSGEAVTLSMSEYEKLLRVAVEQAAGRRPVIGGAGSNSTSHAIELTQIAEEAGCDATLSVGPYYNKPTQKGFLSHFGAIAEAASQPVILYNVPGRTASNISAETTLELAEIPNVVGIKEASGNLSQIMKILSERPSDFLVLSGDDAITLALLALGADGVISVAANQAPKMMHEMTQHALRGRWAEARELHYRLLPLMEINFVETNPVPVKTGVAMMGLVQERFRLPLVRMSSENRTKLQNIMAEIGLI